jgi:hypothetical protein
MFLVFAGSTKKLYFHSLIKKLYAYEASIAPDEGKEDHRSKVKEIRSKSVDVSKEISLKTV